MSQETADIFLSRINDRINRGEFDDKLNIPFASRKLMKTVVEAKMAKKVETGATPVFSDTELNECVEEVRETAASTAAIFLEIGLLEKGDEGLKVSETWDNLLRPK